MGNGATIATYVRVGGAFVRDHPQLWFTALVALLISGAFVAMSLRFAAIAEDAQEQLFNDRAGWLLDGVVLFAPEVLEDAPTLRARLAALAAQNETVEGISILAPHGTGEWRTYVTDTGAGEGRVATYDPLTDQLFRTAWAMPGQAYTASSGSGSGRIFTTARAIVHASGSARALVVVRLRLSEADRRIADSVTTSMILLVVVLSGVVLIFLRHARIVDFATLYKKQLEIDQLKDSFLGMASHELKSPLTVIRGYVEFLRDESLAEDTRREYVRRIDASTEELRLLIDDILDVSRIEMGRLRFSPDYVKPAEVLREVQDMFSGVAAEKGIQVSCEVDEAVREAVVRVDRGRMKQVLINLMSNALKYTLAGSIVLRQRVEGAMLECSVQDTGVGMTADEQKKLFEKFYRVESAETKHVSGTGLGLWITKYIVEHMGGTIAVESIKGEGSRFVVQFPLAKQEGST